MSETKLSELDIFLSSKSKEELKKEIIQLFQAFPQVQEYFSTKIDPEAESKILSKYRRVIKNEFFPKDDEPSLRYSVINKAISDFGKISRTPENVAELMVSCAEYGVDFTNEYGDINEDFYINIERMYEKAILYISKNNLEDHFQKRCKKIMEESEGIGWGFGDAMADIYFENFDGYEEKMLSERKRGQAPT